MLWEQCAAEEVKRFASWSGVLSKDPLLGTGREASWPFLKKRHDQQIALKTEGLFLRHDGSCWEFFDYPGGIGTLHLNVCFKM